MSTNVKRYFLISLLLAGHAWAYSSLVVGPGVSTAALRVPPVAPFTSLGDYRVEFRLHDWGTTADRIMSWGSRYSGGGTYLEINLTAAGEICAYNYVDSFSRGNVSCANVSGHSDIIVRVQRLGAFPTDYSGSVGSFWLEVRDVNGAAISSHCGVGSGGDSGCPIRATGTKDWSGQIGYLGNPLNPTGFSLAWLKWFSTAVMPGSPFSQESAPADLADWRFENNLTNQGTGSYAVTIGLFNHGPSYVVSPMHAPACDAGKPKSMRAGIAGQLDGTGSQPLNGESTLSYFWQQLDGPTTVLWYEGRNTARPQVGQTAFGTYLFQLTATDSSGHSSTCTVKHGFVATDGDDIVITDNSAAITLLGPLIRYGANPWPWFDDRYKAEADMQISVIDTYYPAWWDTAAQGTIAVTAGSNTLTGSGTSFTTDFCQGPGDPNTAKSGAQINVWYPNSSPSGHGVRMHAVASCQGDTQLTLATAWGSDVADCAGGGCSYALWGNDGLWAYNSAPANYYDAVAAFYALYYRTGIEDYRVAARTLADRFWVHNLDSGTVCAGKNGMGGCLYNQRWAPRNISLLGMVLRAQDGRPDMWTGLHTIIAFYRDYYLAGSSPADIAWGLWDIREEAYHMAMVAYGAMYSPDATFRAACKAALSDTMNRLWNVTQSPDGSWKQFYTINNQNSWGTPSSSVTLTHGSNAVTGVGTAWTSAMMTTAQMGGTGRRIIFTPTTAKPANIAAQESTYYIPTYVDATHLTLDRPYEGTTGTHGWALDYGAVGWGVQPFIEGILGLSFGFTAQALADTDPANAALARQHVIDIANWERTAGYRAANGGMQYFAGSVDCMAPIPETSTWCTANNSASQARTLSAESLRSVMLAYSFNGDPNLLAFADTLYNGMYAKPYTCPSGSTLCVPDGSYVSDFNDVWGYYMSGTPPSGRAHKWFGMFFGIGAGSDWPAYRVGGPKSLRRRRVRVGFNIQSVPGASMARVTARAPSGEVVQASCASSPCPVDIDDRQGDHIFELEYLSASGAVMASTKMESAIGR